MVPLQRPRLGVLPSGRTISRIVLAAAAAGALAGLLRAWTSPTAAGAQAEWGIGLAERRAQLVAAAQVSQSLPCTADRVHQGQAGRKRELHEHGVEGSLVKSWASRTVTEPMVSQLRCQFMSAAGPCQLAATQNTLHTSAIMQSS